MIRIPTIDCVKLNNGVTDIRTLEQKYKGIINRIWEQSISTKEDANGNFRFLFSNISGGDLRNHADLLINRPNQSSCSMISSDFIATYGSNSRKIGFMYPNNSEFIMTSAYDLGSNVFGDGIVNKEKGTLLATPEVIERIGSEYAKQIAFAVDIPILIPVKEPAPTTTATKSRQEKSQSSFSFNCSIVGITVTE